MKMVKSLLLGSAAGLVAITAGQAAELPVKAKPVEYVKVCSLYGAGFYYMPGTDMCIKIGGWVRTEATWDANASLAWGEWNGADPMDRATNNLTVRARGYITADAREQTAYGTARAYIAVGVNTSDVGTAASEAPASTYANRAYIQFAGFTSGLAVSFYDFYCAPCQNYRAGNLPTEDTGDGGWWVWGYTAQLGGGFSATLSAEARRMTQIIGQSSVATAAGALTLIDGGTLLSYTGGNGYGGWQAPDIVGNLRVDQAWGSAQIMAAAHEVTPLYYGPTTATAIEGNGHPGDQWGWAVGFGAKILTPAITQGDFLYGEVNYTKGASKYAANTAGTTQEGASGLGQTYGIMSDCVFGGVVGATASSCDLTTAWSGVLSYEHYWTPQWHESFTGAYIAVSYDAQSNAILCTLEGGGNGFVAAGIGTAALATPGCNNNWSYWGAGSRLQWDITKSLYIGVEALYLQTGSAQSWNGLVPAAVGITAPSVCSTGAVCAVSNEHAWVGTVRIHKDFLP